MFVGYAPVNALPDGASMTRTIARFLTLSAFAIAALGTRSAAADDLFSSISNDSVFSGSATPGAAPTPARGDDKVERVQRVLNITQLTDLLRDAGLEPTADETAASIKLQHARWTFTVILGLDEEREQILLLMLLSDFEGKPALSSERLLALLSANRDQRPASFSYSDKHKRIELMMSVANDAISPRLLREEVRRLANMAEGTAGLWEIAAEQPAGATAAASAAKPAAGQVINVPAQKGAAATQPTAASSALAGKWSAARSAKEAFAMQLNADNTFVLVFVKDGKQSRSTGQFTLSGNQLTLSTTEGGKFSGSVTGVTAKSFDFTPPGKAASKLTFQRST